MIKTIRNIFNVLDKKEKRRLLLLLVLMLLSSLLEALGIAVITYYISFFEDIARVNHIPVIGTFLANLNLSNRRLLIVLTTVLFLFFILKNIFLSYVIYNRSNFVFNQQISLGTRLYSNYLFTDYSFHLHHNSSELLRNLRDNIDQTIDYFIMPLLKTILESLTLIFILAILLVSNSIETIVAVFVFGISGYLFLKYLKKKNLNYGKIEQRQRVEMTKSIQNGLGGLKEIIVSNKQNYYLKNYIDHVNGFIKAAQFKRITSEISRPYIETFSIALILLVAVITLLSSSNYADIIPVITLFAVAGIRLVPTTNTIMTSINTMKFYQNAVNTIHRDLTTLKPSDDMTTLPGQNIVKMGFRNNIQLKNLSFSYDKQNDILTNIDLTIHKNESVAFVGHSGAGKTTLVDLILGLLKPTGGEIVVDGVPIDQNIKGWRRIVSYIPQNIFLSEDTIKNNIAFGEIQDDIDEGRLLGAIEIAQLNDFIESLPEGVNTNIGERGIRISGGQRQRIGIARAIYKRPEILIMDEATAALDNETEKNFLESLSQIHGKYTIITIAHRFTTIMDADKIFFLKNGEIKSSGSYEELIEQDPDFKKLAIT